MAQVTPTPAHTMSSLAWRWLSLLQEHAGGHNWQITINNSSKSGLSVHVVHDAPDAILDRGVKVQAGERKTIFEEGAK